MIYVNARFSQINAITVNECNLAYNVKSTFGQVFSLGKVDLKGNHLLHIMQVEMNYKKQQFCNLKVLLILNFSILNVQINHFKETLACVVVYWVPWTKNNFIDNKFDFIRKLKN